MGCQMDLKNKNRNGRLDLSNNNQNLTGRSAMFSAFRRPTFFMKAVQLGVAAAMVLSQPVYARQILADAKIAGPVLTKENPTVIPGFPGFQLAAPSNTQQSNADEQPLVSLDAYALLTDFVKTTDQGGGADDQAQTLTQQSVAPNDATHAAVGALSQNAGDAYSILNGYLKATDPARAAAAQGQAPADSTHAAFFGGKGVVVSDAEPAITAPHGSGQPVLLAANEAKPKTAKKLEKENGGASYVGSQACVKCHKSQFGAFSETLHGKVLLKQPRNATEKLGCESCHGPASTHIQSKEGDNGGAADIIGFSKESPRPVEDRNAVCLNCHEKADRTYWNGSTHETRGLACTNCHQLMEKVSVKNQLAKSTELETCFQCHKDRRAQLARSSHMPLDKGAMTCSSCHNPHGSATDKLLKEASVNETCYKCHADKRGPFLWEHEPVRDNCLNCHDPHGTVTQYMLKIQRPRLCQSCHMGPGHGNPGNPMTVQSTNRSCQNCHTLVHGSNSPAGMLFQR